MSIDKSLLRTVDNLTEDEIDKVVGYIEERFPEDVQICLLTLTGSRAFGWGGDRYDRDVRIVFHLKRPYWDTLHIGYKGCDISGEDLEHMMRRMRWRWTIFEDLSKPIYIHPSFDFEGFQANCSRDNVTAHRYTIKLERARFETQPAIRSALHCYRQHMEPIYFLKTGKIEINVLKINDAMWNFEQLPYLCEMYKTRQFKEVDWTPVREEMDSLEVELDETIENTTSEFDKDRYYSWIDNMREAFGSTETKYPKID